jgi:hypothetical protein
MPSPAGMFAHSRTQTRLKLPLPLRRMLALLIVLVPDPARTFEFYVGGSDLSPSSNVVRWVNTSWADGLSVGFPPTYTPADLVRLSSATPSGQGLRLLACVHANTETMQRQLADHGATGQQQQQLFTFAYATLLADFANATASAPRPFWWASFIEDDSSGVGFPYTQLAVPPSDAAEAWEQWDQYLTRSLAMTGAVVPLAAAVPRVAQVGGVNGMGECLVVRVQDTWLWPLFARLVRETQAQFTRSHRVDDCCPAMQEAPLRVLSSLPCYLPDSAVCHRCAVTIGGLDRWASARRLTRTRRAVSTCCSLSAPTTTSATSPRLWPLAAGPPGSMASPGASTFPGAHASTRSLLASWPGRQVDRQTAAMAFSPFHACMHLCRQADGQTDRQQA